MHIKLLNRRSSRKKMFISNIWILGSLIEAVIGFIMLILLRVDSFYVNRFNFFFFVQLVLIISLVCHRLSNKSIVKLAKEQRDIYRELGLILGNRKLFFCKFVRLVSGLLLFTVLFLSFLSLFFMFNKLDGKIYLNVENIFLLNLSLVLLCVLFISGSVASLLSVLFDVFTEDHEAIVDSKYIVSCMFLRFIGGISVFWIIPPLVCYFMSISGNFWFLILLPIPPWLIICLIWGWYLTKLIKIYPPDYVIQRIKGRLKEIES